jgi:hypothetical protein
VPLPFSRVDILGLEGEYKPRVVYVKTQGTLIPPQSIDDKTSDWANERLLASVRGKTIKKPKHPRKRPVRRALRETLSEEGWRSAAEVLGPPNPHLVSFVDRPDVPEKDSCDLSEEHVDEIAHLTQVQAVSRPHFRVALVEICDEILSSELFWALADVPRPQVLLNRVAKTARQLSRHLTQADQSESRILDGTLITLFPRALLRARLNPVSYEIDVRSDGAWLFLDGLLYAELLSGLADCALVAANKMSADDAARRLGTRITLKPGGYEAVKATPPSQRARNASLRNLIQRLRDLIVDKAQGKLTLWNDPEGVEPKGTLPAVLKILRPYLPDIIPLRLNYKTLRQYLKTRS